MAIEINVPDIGADEVEITEILVKVGDKVEAEQSLITVEGDKASMEVPSPQAGIVKELSLIHISEPTRQAENSYAVFCLKKKKKADLCLKKKKNNSEKQNLSAERQLIDY